MLTPEQVKEIRESVPTVERINALADEVERLRGILMRAIEDENIVAARKAYRRAAGLLQETRHALPEGTLLVAHELLKAELAIKKMAEEEETRAGDRANCRSCGASIWWLQTSTDKWMPVDRDVSGKPPAGAFFDPKTMVSHFATCPDAKKWRGKERDEGPVG